ncbi:MAG: ComF family protein [Candidatus Omnitrophica bacterium]|nr:ComF family protein [Candidatus Omnitrophota bacterium]
MIKEYLANLVNVILPPTCFGCGRKINRGILCEACYRKLQPVKPPFCRRCGKEISQQESTLCYQCQKKQIYHNMLIPCFYYNDLIKKLIHLFKYSHYDYLAEFFSSLIIKHLSTLGFSFSHYDYITYVPSHHLRLREREYNQSYLLAKHLSNFFKITFNDKIIFCKEIKPSQTKLERNKRQANVKDIFEVRENLTNKRIILVDDIITTGSTLSECSRVLKEKGAAYITLITLAKA